MVTVTWYLGALSSHAVLGSIKSANCRVAAAAATTSIGKAEAAPRVRVAVAGRVVPRRVCIRAAAPYPAALLRPPGAAPLAHATRHYQHHLK